MANSGRLVKMEVDYSAIVEQRLPELQEMAKVRNRFRKNGMARVIQSVRGREH